MAAITAVLLAIALCACASAAKDITLYVSLAGNDTWTGLLPAPLPCMCDGPLRTIQHGIDTATGMAASQLLIRGGTYYVPSTVHVNRASNLAIGPYRTENVVISGGSVLTGTWKPQSGSNIWILNVSSSAPHIFLQLWKNNTRLVRARSPNPGAFFTIKSDLNGSLSGQGFVYQGTAIDFLSTLDAYSLSQCDVILYRSWQAARRSIASVNPTTHTAMLTFPAGIEPTGNSEGRFYVENFKQGLDMPGEYFMDAQAGLLYYVAEAGEDPNKNEFVAPVVVSDLVLLQDTSNVTLFGLSFRHVDWNRSRAIQDSGAIQAASFLIGAAVHVVRSINFRLLNSEVAHVGENGVWFEDNSTMGAVMHSYIHDLGAGGVRIGRGKPLPDEAPGARSGNVLLSDNTIVFGSRVFPEGNGVLIQKSSYNLLDHCEVAFFNHVGVSIGWTWDYSPSEANHNVISYNRVHHLGNGELSDFAGIYLLGISPGTEVHHNIVHDALALHQYGHGIYLDQATTNVTVAMNVVYNILAAAFYQHFGRDNDIYNNVFAYSFGGYGTLWHDADPSFGLSTFSFHENIVLVDERAGGVFECPFLGNSTFDRNLYYNTSGPLSSTFPSPTPTSCSWSLDQWRASGQDRSSRVADPLFANLSAYNFSVPADSPAVALGFEPFDVEAIGPRTLFPWQPVCSSPSGPVVSCGAPSIPHATVFGADFTCGASVRVLCAPSYVLSGATILTCSGQGWGPLPVCIAGGPAA